MGGDHLHSFDSEDESSTLDNDNYSEISSYPSSFYRDGTRVRDVDESSRSSSGYLYNGFEDLGHGIQSNSVEFDNNLRRRKISYNEIMRNYDELWARRECLFQAKNKILSYTPGAWVSNAGNKKLQDYVLPKTTSLLLVGPKGSGKSSLVNRISRMFENDKFASERAQVTYNSYSGEGTFFLHEYMIPRGSTSFCLFDTRSLAEDFVENDEKLQLWMIKGVRHGELVVRDSDSPGLKTSLECKAQQSGTPSSQIRKINFVIFVVNGLSVLSSMNSQMEEASRYMEMVSKTFNCPYLSFKDDKPIIVVTHGDLLSLGDRARVRLYLGEKLGVPPAKQIFDIPDNSDPLTELTIVDMIRYSLEHADKHMPYRESREWVGRSKISIARFKREVSVSSIVTLMFLAVLLGIACVAFPMHRSHYHNALPESVNSSMTYPCVPRESLPRESVINDSQNEKPLATPQTVPSKSVVVTQEYENREPETALSQASPSPHVQENQKRENLEPNLENQGYEVASNFPSQSLLKYLPQEDWEAKHDASTSSSSASESRATTSQPSKSDATSPPTSHPESAREFPSPEKRHPVGDSRDISRSPSPKKRHPTSDSREKSPSPSHQKRHPKMAVQWHKIRHLWLDD